MIKIAHLTPTFSRFNGIDRVVEQQARDQVKAGNSVTIFALAADMDPPGNVQLRTLGMPGHLFWQRVYRLIFPMDIIKTLKWVTCLRHFDIVYAHQYPMTWLACLGRIFYGIHYVYYDYGFAPASMFSNFIERTYWRLFKTLSFCTAKGAVEAVTISVYLQQQLRKDTGLIGKVVYPQIDMQRFRNAGDGSLIREKYKIEDCPLVLYVGRIAPHKGIHLLISAFMAARQEIHNAQLIIVGKHTFSNYTKKLKRLADSSVIFTGDVSDEELSHYYAACDVYATATLWEGLNLPLVEAQAYGKPVVAFNLGPHPEVVQDGTTGFLVPPEDTAAMADAITKLLKNSELLKEMGEKASEWARNKFGLCKNNS